MPLRSFGKRKYLDRPDKDDLHSTDPSDTSVGKTIKMQFDTATRTNPKRESKDLKNLIGPDVPRGESLMDASDVDRETVVYKACRLGQSSLKEDNEPRFTTSLSKRAKKLAAIEGEVGSNDKAKGSIKRNADNTLWWRPDANSKWELAVFHQDLRTELIAECAELGEYVHSRKKGRHADDVTSFHKDHETWGPDRSDRPDILFQIEPRHNSELLEAGSIWYRDNRVVLDSNNNPVKNFSDIPSTCSSELEGFEIEAIQRLNPNITVHDLLARMPHNRILRSGEMHKQFNPSTIGMRGLRFRERTGCLTWLNRAGSGNIYDYLMKLWPEECKTANSTKAFRDLTLKEKQGMKAVNRGLFTHLKGGQLSRGQHSGVSVKSKKKEEVDAIDIKDLSTSQNPRLESKSFRRLANTSMKRKVSNEGTGPIIKKILRDASYTKQDGGYSVSHGSGLDHTDHSELAQGPTRTEIHCGEDLTRKEPLEIGIRVAYELPQDDYFRDAFAVTEPSFSYPEPSFSTDTSQADSPYYLERTAACDHGSLSNGSDYGTVVNNQNNFECVFANPEPSRSRVPGCVRDPHDQASVGDDIL